MGSGDRRAEEGGGVKYKELRYTGIIECPYPGCKRGFHTELWESYQTYCCPEHNTPFCAVLEDKKGNKYRILERWQEWTQEN